MKLSIEFNLSDADYKALAFSIPETDIEKELTLLANSALRSKIDAARNEIYLHNIQKIKEEHDSIPTDDDALIDLIVAQPDYQDAATKLATTQQIEENNETRS